MFIDKAIVVGLWQFITDVNNCIMLCCCSNILPNSFCCYEKDYAWVKHGVIFPFLEYLDRWVITHFAYFNL